MGWNRPMLWAAAEVLEARFAAAARRDFGKILVVVPGRQAGRRLRQILQTDAHKRRVRMTATEIITPAQLTERFCPAALPLASPSNAHCAWLRAVQGLTSADREILAPSDAADFAAVRAELMSNGLSFAEAAARCAALAGYCDDRRWDVLVRLEELYRDTLAHAGLQDANDARRQALQEPGNLHGPPIILIGLIDLSRWERALLQALPQPVTALIPAPQECAEGFDAVGCLRPDYWHNRALPLRDDRLIFSETPTAETHRIASRIAALRADDPEQEVRLGVGDEHTVDRLAQRLAARGLPTRSPYGLRLSRTRPAVLFQWVRDFLTLPSAHRFAVLVRHPDLERRLTDGEPLLDALDTFLSERLPEQMPEADTLSPPLSQACQIITTLLAPLRNTRPLQAWAEPLNALLDAVYCEEPFGEDAEGRQLQRALQGMRDAIQALAEVLPDLAPRLTGQEALAYLLRRLDGPRLPDDMHSDGMEMRGWLELAWDDAPALLLTGLYEGAVPHAMPPDPLLPETLRRHLGLPDGQRRQARDAFLLRVMLESRPETWLFASRRGADGEPQRPSRLLFLCDGETAARRALRFAEGHLESEAATGQRKPLFQSGDRRQLPPPRPEPPSPPLAQLRATAFRDYLACPYRFYLRHILKLEERDDSADEMNARQFGEMIHLCLAALAHSTVVTSAEPDRVRDFLHTQLRQQARQRFGSEPPAAVRLQMRQAGRRLEAFADWQSQQAAEGWVIQRPWAERDLEATLWVDDQPFIVTGRLDRVDYHAGEDRYRIMDYKTGDTGVGPEAKHRGKASADGRRPWIDLQLPLYRLLAEANGISVDRLDVGYALLPADLHKVSYAATDWTGEDYQEARICTEDVIRALRQGRFWPPAPSGSFLDELSPLCLDRCRDRSEWFGDNLT